MLVADYSGVADFVLAKRTPPLIYYTPLLNWEVSPTFWRGYTGLVFQYTEVDFVHFAATATASHGNRSTKPACAGWIVLAAEYSGVADFVLTNRSLPLIRYNPLPNWEYFPTFWRGYTGLVFQSTKVDFVHFAATATVSHGNRSTKPACAGWIVLAADYSGVADFVLANRSLPLIRYNLLPNWEHSPTFWRGYTGLVFQYTEVD
ncbi:MAG: hypothetical protein KJ638_13035, partial [Chloroflexi bacterium]|nr:hypothetical protein [Chloroflexota bacterium]